MWAFTGKQCWRCGVNRERINDVRVLIYEIPSRMLAGEYSGTVAMKVGNR